MFPDSSTHAPCGFHPARTLSGSLCSPPSPRGEGFVSGIPLPPIQPPPLRATSFHKKEGVSTRAPSLGRGCRPQRGGVGFLFAAKPPPLCLPHWGRGTASAVDRMLSLTAYLRRSFPLSFIPLEPYPARFARHLPHAGKALSVVILFLHVSCIRFGDTRILSSKKGGEAAT